MKVAKIYIEYEHMSLNQSFLYACGILDAKVGMRALVPFANQQIVGFITEIKQMDTHMISQLEYEIKDICSLLDEQPLLNVELLQLAKYMANRYVAPYISCLSAMLPSKLKPRSSAKQSRKETWMLFQQAHDLKTPKQIEAQRFIMQHQEVKRSEFNKKFAGQYQSLLIKGVFVLEEREAQTYVWNEYDGVTFNLLDEQIQAISKMDHAHHQVYVLHGVTGSGKTEVFLQMAQKEVERNKQVLILVPEISLTPQMVQRVKARFKEKVAIYHSSLNNQEKYEQYQKVAKQEVSIVVGTRSAIFMPFENLGLIILDEEHDGSYKQVSTPKYHTRDIAIQRGMHHECKVILASATPSLESYARALKGVYTLVEMKNRVANQMPRTHLIDMKKAMRNGDHYMLSHVMKQQIQQRLARNEQCILLLNRRGYAPLLRCVDCGHIKMCPHCDMALNYHKANHSLVCHMCGYQEKHTGNCVKCNSKQLRYVGLGTQRLEEYVQECFPDASIIRMDADTTSKKNAHQKLLNKFEQEGDILLGTQMIAKGLDYARVTMVGILNGDVMLNRSDYRSAELTFDLLVQASGRSGRGAQCGEVFIQVYDPHHYAITSACQHDYQSFFYQEMKFRHLANYPPYLYLSSIIVLHKDESVVKKEIQFIYALLKKEYAHADFKLLGPSPLTKIQDHYRFRIILKSKDEKIMSEALMHVYKENKAQKNKSRMEVDINPYTMD